MDVYWVDTANDLKRDYLQFGKKVMLTTVYAKTFFLIDASCKGVVYEPQGIMSAHACYSVILQIFKCSYYFVVLLA